MKDLGKKTNRATNNTSSFNSNMTINPLTTRCGKKVFQPKKTPERSRPSKRHYEQSRNSELSVLTRGKKVSLHTWKPSSNLIEYNDKTRLILLNSKRLKKEVEGKDLNKSSIIGMIGLSNIEKVNSNKRYLNSSKMEKILSYKNGPKYREIRVTEKVPKINMRARSTTPEAVKERNMKFIEYSINKTNNSTSKVIFG